MRPHDLLRLASPTAVEAAAAPAWVAAALAATPWVVARRAGEAGGRIAVGVRGATRSERFAAHVPTTAVVETLGPEDLADRPPPRAHSAFDAMAALRPALDDVGCGWGPAGAAGFELATGRPALTADSDLDLVLRLRAPPRDGVLAGLAAAARRAPLRVDVLLEAPAGAAALEEYLSDVESVLLRTREGPRLARRGALWTGPC
ncbi:malonate decarboxylase holo-ACP synthase [Chenggangzhangella methanolivorans]|uniref:Malonate decarboxylase holo-ACP synthase n=1 Tax=Chenggangzhangella methanolivorans TaxID=1437009 RepID=A0A9E6R6M8_9HYPH|nr:malonate decarboxylase holo-ACP synthase [Chenggangzhangella methanolivorans]QZN98918.1 malonate decarboxylase holo-ACP synthase [Chenggangzhangella methanolivorans]